MAGTRLFIQSLALVELLALAAWSFYYGLCRGDDILCQRAFWLSDEAPLHPLPPLDAPTSLPLVQVDKSLHPDTKLEWRKNPNTVIVCSQPESPVVQGQIFWRCPPVFPQDPPRIVVRESSMLIFSKEWQLPELARPGVSSPFLLRVHIVLEQSGDTASAALSLAASLQDQVVMLEDWPCVAQVQVKMTVVEPHTSKWVVPESTSEETGETIATHLPRVTDSQAQELLEKLGLPISADEQELVLYITSLNPSETSSFQVGAEQSQLFMVGGWDTPAVQQWLSSKVGIPLDGLDGDGSFPTWYEEWYWYSAAQEMTKRIVQAYTRSQRFVEKPLKLETSKSLKKHYAALVKLHKDLEAILSQKTIHTDFPVEHYAAIFAPLLFPLLLPFLVSTIKESKRYKEKKKRKTEEKEKKD